MIAQREEEIRKFQPETYYGWKVSALRMTFVWEGKNGNQRIFKKDLAQNIGKKLKAQKITIKKVERKEKKTYAPELYDLTALQKEASKRYGFSPKQTLNLMQSLYEHHKILTYPRTDSRYLTSDMTDTLKDRIKASAAGPYKKTAALLLRKEIKGNRRFVNDKKVSDHHAIIPTEQSVRLMELSADERKIYDMVVRRFFAVLMEPSVSEQIRIRGEISGEQLQAKAVLQKKAGWKDACEDQEQEENMMTNLPDLPEEGKQYVCDAPVMTEGKQKRRDDIQKVR